MSDFKITGPGMYRTRDGKKADVVGQATSGLWYGEVSDDYARRWRGNGAVYGDDNRGFDLIAPWTEPKKGTVWVNVYADYFTTYPSRAGADMYKGDRIACVSVNWTEGEGLS